jgi:predicted enzyme related to lactoylglutathione lyase
MSERNGYEHGVPSWIAGAHADPDQAAAFYTELLGWDADRRGDHLVCTLRGRDVAGFVRGDEPAWRTNVWVENADETAERAQAAGGSVVTAPFELAGVGRSAVLADPAGAVFTVSEPDPHRGAEVVNEPGAWAMSALSTPDPEGAEAFYGAVFGWETEAFGPATLWRLPGFVGGEPEQSVARDVVAVAMPGDQPRWDVDLWVDDPDATAEKAAELGGTVLMAPTDTPMGRRAVLADPQGASFSVSRVKPS